MEQGEEMGQGKLKRKIEAALFMAPGAVTVNDLSKATGKSNAEVRVALNELVHEYAERDSALEVRDEESGFRMTVRAEHEESVGHMASAPEFHKGIMKK
ncbi:SMC-Scp complex subunit ScpB, partial [Candidatus Micrarchaeota archaeon]|nr:SMC-Scp complex subunit ScpB [Candidatus Micrarchaeota archaeon]